MKRVAGAAGELHPHGLLLRVLVDRVDAVLAAEAGDAVAIYFRTRFAVAHSPGEYVV